MLHTFTLQCPVYLSAYERDDFPLKAMVQFCAKRSILFLTSNIQHRTLEDGNEIVHELSRRDFYQEMVTVILDTRMGPTKCTHNQNQKLHIGILVVQPSLHCAHSIFRLTDFERIWSDISRCRAISSKPNGNSSDVALSTGVWLSVVMISCT